MTSLLQRALKRDITSIDDYIQALSFKGNQYTFLPQVQQTLTGDRVERPGDDLVSFGRRLYVENGIVFACMSMRAYVFSAVRMIYQRMLDGRPSSLFHPRSLAIFEEPWVGGSAQDLLALISQDFDVAGNSYWARANGDFGEELVRLEPTFVDLILERRRDGLGHRKIGYLYWELGRGTGRPKPLTLREVAHCMPPMRDPFEWYKGMSWMRAIFSEVANDRLMERHKSRTFENGATPNMVVKFDRDTDEDAFEEFVEKFRPAYEGPENAGKTMLLSPGVDIEVVGRDFQQLAFEKIQGHAETRIAAAAGVPPQIIPFSEGMQGSSLNANVYTSARRRFADATMHPLWQATSGALAILAPAPFGTRLWYDTRDVPFIRDDEMDIGQIQQRKAQTIRNLTDAGFTPVSAVAAVEADDFALLEHSGLFSVQLQKPGTSEPTDEADEPETEPETEPAGDTDD